MQFVSLTELKLVTDFDLISDDHSLFVAHRFDLGDQEIPVVQLRQCLLQGRVQIALQSEPCRGRKNARVDAIRQPAAILGDQLDLSGGDRCSTGWLVREPVPGREENKDEDQDDRQVELPSAAIVRPEKSLRKNLS